MIRTARTVVLVAAALTLVSCSTVQRLNPFKGRGGENASLEGAGAPEERTRIPLIALDQQLRVNDALKGVGFYLPPAAPQADWPLPGGTLEQTVEHVDAAPDFEIAWKRDIGRAGGRAQFITAPPIAAGGRIYTMDAGAQVTATDARTGHVVWRANLVPKTLPDGTRPRRLVPPIFAHNGIVDPIAFGGGLAFADGKIFVTSGYRFVSAVDANTGAVLWTTRTTAPIHAAPTVSGGRVFAVSTINELMTFDAGTGQIGWAHQGLVEPARILQASSPAISGDTIVAAFSSGELTALRTTNGAELWSGNLTRVSRTTALSEIRDIPGRPIIYRGDVLAGSHSGVFAAVDFRTGQLRWELPIITTANPWAAGDVVYTVSKSGEVVCIARESGQVYWIRDLNEGRRSTRVSRFLGRERNDRAYWSGPILASNRLITVSSDGRAAALDPKTGEVLSYLKLGAPALITPIAVGGMLYVVTDKGDLIAIR